MSVISRTADSNTVSDYYVTRLAGPRVAGRRVAEGEKVRLTEYQARAHLAAGEVVKDEARVDDPFGEAAAALEKREAAEKAAAEAREAADRAKAEALAVNHDDAPAA